MKLLTDELRERLEANHRETVGCIEESREEPDHFPVVKLCTPWLGAAWLITEILPDGRMFGLCDPGLKTPELGYVHIRELEAYRGPAEMRIARVSNWKARGTLTEYADAAYKAQKIVEVK